MKRIYTIEEAVYFQKPEENNISESLAEKPESFYQAIAISVENQSIKESKINVLLDEIRLEENCNKINIKINKDEFRSMFGPKAKPRKGDYLSITKNDTKFKVKKAKKFASKVGSGKKAKGFKLSLKKIE